MNIPKDIKKIVTVLEKIRYQLTIHSQAIRTNQERLLTLTKEFDEIKKVIDSDRPGRHTEIP